jgi:hypothetical protein
MKPNLGWALITEYQHLTGAQPAQLFNDGICFDTVEFIRWKQIEGLTRIAKLDETSTNCRMFSMLCAPQNTGFGGGLSEVRPRAREQEVGGDHDPEGVIADNRYLDEHAKDRKDHQQERDYNPKVHCAYLLALRRSAQNPA